jgi:hypothetical protein
MSVEHHRPPKLEESRKIQKFSTEKTIPYPGFEPRTSELAVGSLNHCTIGSVSRWILKVAYDYDNKTFVLEIFKILRSSHERP